MKLLGLGAFLLDIPIFPIYRSMYPHAAALLALYCVLAENEEEEQDYDGGGTRGKSIPPKHHKTRTLNLDSC